MFNKWGTLTSAHIKRIFSTRNFLPHPMIYSLRANSFSILCVLYVNLVVVKCLFRCASFNSIKISSEISLSLYTLIPSYLILCFSRNKIDWKTTLMIKISSPFFNFKLLYFEFSSNSTWKMRIKGIFDTWTARIFFFLSFTVLWWCNQNSSYNVNTMLINTAIINRSFRSLRKQ